MNSTTTTAKPVEHGRRPQVPPLSALAAARHRVEHADKYAARRDDKAFQARQEAVVLSDRYIEKRAEKQLQRTLKEVAKKSADINFDEKFMHITLPCISERARDEFLQKAWVDAKEWLRSDTARKLRTERRKSIKDDLRKFQERKDAAAEEERQNAQALATFKAQEAKLQKEAFIRRRNELRAEVKAWHEKRRSSTEVKKTRRCNTADQVRHQILSSIAERNRDGLLAAVEEAQKCEGLEKYLIPRANDILKVLNAEQEIAQAMQMESQDEEKFETLTIALQRGERIEGVQKAVIRRANSMLTEQCSPPKQGGEDDAAEEEPMKAVATEPAHASSAACASQPCTPEAVGDPDNFHVVVQTTTGKEHTITGLYREQDFVSFRNQVATACGVHAGMVKLILQHKHRVFARHDLAKPLDELGIHPGVKLIDMGNLKIHVDLGMNLALLSAGVVAVNGVYRAEKEDANHLDLGYTGKFQFRREEEAFKIRWYQKAGEPETAGWYVEENPEAKLYFLPSKDPLSLPLTQWQVYIGDGAKPGAPPVPTIQEEPSLGAAPQRESVSDFFLNSSATEH